MAKKRTKRYYDYPFPKEVIGALADAFGKSTDSIIRWIKTDDDRLTSDKARKVFKEKGVVWKEHEIIESDGMEDGTHKVERISSVNVK